MNNNFIGEHLLPGQIGHFMVLLSFMASLGAFIAFFISYRNTTNSQLSTEWQNFGKWAFRTHAIAVLGIGATLFYIIYNHLFEYQYAWQHSSKALPTYYMISCFWEGQEGSFWLWTFWNVVLGLILIRSAKQWTSPVMLVVSLVQIALSSMLLGVYVFNYKIGSSPFMLLRETMEAPIFSQPDYLKNIADGNGLNPLLQNLWMVIHPPILFLGFASFVVPFAFMMAGLLTKSYKDWMYAALPWALFCALIHGTGVMMGGAWAYESLTFGGYWAWDPVENASLIPWLLLIGGIHGMLVYKKTGHSGLLTVILIPLSFLLVLYATFLTRSGILGNASVHSFTDLGMSGQLLAFLLLFLALVVFVLVLNWKNLPRTKTDEQLSSREFWIFMGTLVLILSAVHIVLVTSIPVWNKLFGTNIAPPADVIAHYNKFQLPIAILLIALTGVAQLMKYKKSIKDQLTKALLLPTAVGVIGAIGLSILFELNDWQYILLLFSCFLAITANGKIAYIQLKKPGKSGAAIAHIGFSLMLVGVLISSAKKETVSINKSGLTYGEGFKDKDNEENVLLWRNQPLLMNGYQVTYLGDSTVAPNIYYKVNYKKTDPATGKIKENFTLTPNAQINPKMGLIANPDTRHFLLKDLYTHVTKVPDKAGAKQMAEYRDPQSLTFEIGKPDTMMLSENLFILKGITKTLSPEMASTTKGAEVAVAAIVNIKSLNGDTTLQPVYAIKNGSVFNYEVKAESFGIKIWLSKIDPEHNTITLNIAEKTPAPKDYIILKAMIFPYINLLWLGVVIMVLGFSIAVMDRYKEAKKWESQGV